MWKTEIRDTLKGNRNLFLMLCGHSTGEAMRQDTNGGSTVYSLLSDYQTHNRGGNGWLRLLEFSPSNHVIRVQTFSPWTGKEETDADSQFTLDYNMANPSAFRMIGSPLNVPASTRVSMPWTNLTADAEYEWHVTVSDGVDTLTSPLWRFTTATQAAPRLSLAATAGGLWWQVTGERGGKYQIETSPDLMRWSVFGAVLSNATGQAEFRDAVVTNTQRFYRARQVW